MTTILGIFCERDNLNLKMGSIPSFCPDFINNNKNNLLNWAQKFKQQDGNGNEKDPKSALFYRDHPELTILQV